MVEVSYPTFNVTTRCIPLDVTDKFEAQPTKAEVEAQGLAYINANQTYLPAQTIKVDFVRITESGEYQQFANLQKCKLCDTIRVIFSRYNMEGTFKIVRTEYDVLQERYSVMELGTLSTTLSEALGINQESANRLNTRTEHAPVWIEDKTSESKSIAANSAGYIDIDMTSVTPSGYTLVGIAQLTSNASGAVPISWQVNTNTIRVYYRNVTSSAVTQTVSVTGLFSLNT